MILEVVRVLKEYIESVEIPETSDVYRALDEKVTHFEILTSKFVEDSEIIAKCMRYTRRVLVALQPARVGIKKAKAFINHMLSRWVTEKIEDSEKFIIKNV